MRRSRQFCWTFFAVGLIVCVLIGTSVSIAPASALVQVCIQGCPPPPKCPTPYSSSVSVIAVTIYSYNATVTWEVSSAAGGGSTFTWGPTTSYQYTAANGASNNAEQTVMLGPLSPTTTYYYHIATDPSCSDNSGTHYYPGSYSGSFTTYSSSILLTWGSNLPGYYIPPLFSGICGEIYMTNDSNVNGIPITSCPGSNDQAYTYNGVGNAVTAEEQPGVPGNLNYSEYFYHNGMLWITLLWAGSGVTQYYYSPPTELGGPAYLWYVQDIQLMASVTAQSPSNPVPAATTMTIQPNFNLGFNSTLGTDNGQETKGDFTTLMSVALDILGAFVPVVDALSLTMDTAQFLAQLLGDIGEFTDGHAPALSSTGGGEVEQWFVTHGGNVKECIYICNETKQGSSGQNVFGAEDQAYIYIPGPFNTGASYNINLGADNQVGDMPVPAAAGIGTCEQISTLYTCGVAPTSYGGASATLSIPAMPAYGFGGSVKTSTGGEAAGASVKVLQFSSCSASSKVCYYNEYPLTADSSGYWHFFGNPGTVYVYQACYNSACSTFGITSSISNELGLDYESENIVT